MRQFITVVAVLSILCTLLPVEGQLQRWATTSPSATEIGYVSGVTSAIQTQLGTKAPTASPTFTGTVTIPTGAQITSPTILGTIPAKVRIGPITGGNEAFTIYKIFNSATDYEALTVFPGNGGTEYAIASDKGSGGGSYRPIGIYGSPTYLGVAGVGPKMNVDSTGVNVTSRLNATSTAVEHQFVNSWTGRNTLLVQNLNTNGYSAINFAHSAAPIGTEQHGAAMGYGNENGSGIFAGATYIEAYNIISPYALNPIRLIMSGDFGGGFGNFLRQEFATNGTITFYQPSGTYPSQPIAMSIGSTGDIGLTKTITAAGTTGAQTINKTTGSVNFAASAQSLTVTDSFCTTSSVIMATVATDDTTAKSCIAVPGSGSFVLKLNAAATAETRVQFLITN